MIIIPVQRGWTGARGRGFDSRWTPTLLLTRTRNYAKAVNALYVQRVGLEKPNAAKAVGLIRITGYINPWGLSSIVYPSNGAPSVSAY